MKKIIFICLLSLSVCFSKPADQQDAPVQTPKTPNTSIANAKSETQAKPAENPPVEPHTDIKPIITAQSSPVSDQSSATPVQNAPQLNPTQTENVPQNSHPNTEVTKKVITTNETAADTQKNNTNNKTTHEEKKVEPNKNDNKPDSDKHEASKPKDDTKKAADSKPNAENNAVVNHDTKPENKTEKNGTPTQKNDVTPKSTEVPKTDADKHEAVLQGRSFDGPSFIGGIILTLGLLAISFMGFKYYKNQTERNYHTL